MLTTVIAVLAVALLCMFALWEPPPWAR